MRDCDLHPRQLDDGHLIEAVANIEVVCVAMNRVHRRDRLELRDDVEIPNVTRMQDYIHILEDVEDLRAQFAVRVADQPDFNTPSSLPS